MAFWLESIKPFTLFPLRFECDLGGPVTVGLGLGQAEISTISFQKEATTSKVYLRISEYTR